MLLKFRGLLAAALTVTLFSCSTGSAEKEKEEYEEYDYPEEAQLFEIMKTKDPALGRVPRERLVRALEYTQMLRNSTPNGILSGVWDERGPFSDTYNVATNGNTRYNNDLSSGRIRSIWVDQNDPSGNTLWAGGVAGGLWKGTNVTSSNPTWTLVSDFFSNMAVTSICQNPANPSIMYFGTGEGFFNADAVQGDGIWKSSDGGNTWAQLASTTGFDFVTKMLCDASGNLYVALRNNSTGGGLQRSMDGGSTWTNITPTGLSTRGSDLEISSTGRLHFVTGFGNTSIGGYRFTDNPTTVSAGTWTAATTPFTFPTGAGTRVEIACSGNTLYCLPSTGSPSSHITSTWKSTDGGANWATVTAVTSPLSTFTNGQGWYCMGIDIDPANPNNVITGSLDCWKTTDGGTSWTKLSQWAGNTGTPNEYVHADIHDVKYLSGNRVYVASDGGVFYSDDAGATFRDRNNGLRIKQFYSCAIHPSNTHYILGGTQDNGVHKFSVAGLGATKEVTGGDGAFVHIDQTPGDNFSFGSFVYNRYRRSTDQYTSNNNSINFFNGSAAAPSDFGLFINPTDYDDAQNIMYCANGASGTYFRWNNPTTCPAGTYYSSSGYGGHAENVTLTALGGGVVTAVTVSPYTSNRVFFGTSGGRVCYADAANAGTSIAGTILGSLGTYINCVAVGTSDDHLLAVSTNYGVNQVMYSSNATSGSPTWTAIDGNLPDMPVRWAMFAPGNNTKVIIATEAGVYTTSLVNGASTAWTVSPTFPLVRTDMLQYRSSDGLVVAATHGRGMWTQNVNTVIPVYDFLLNGTMLSDDAVKVAWNCNWASAASKFDVEVSTDGSSFTKVATVNGSSNTSSYQYVYRPAAPFTRLFFRIRNSEQNVISKYSNTIRISAAGTIKVFELSNIMPNPVQSDFLARFNTVEKGEASLEIYDAAGRMVSNRKVPVPNAGAYSIPYNVSRLQSGTYTLVMRMNGYKADQRMVKQ